MLKLANEICSEKEWLSTSETGLRTPCQECVVTSNFCHYPAVRGGLYLDLYVWHCWPGIQIQRIRGPGRQQVAAKVFLCYIWSTGRFLCIVEFVSQALFRLDTSPGADQGLAFFVQPLVHSAKFSVKPPTFFNAIDINLVKSFVFFYFKGGRLRWGGPSFLKVKWVFCSV